MRSLKNTTCFGSVLEILNSPNRGMRKKLESLASVRPSNRLNRVAPCSIAGIRKSGETARSRIHAALIIPEIPSEMVHPLVKRRISA